MCRVLGKVLLLAILVEVEGKRLQKTHVSNSGVHVYASTHLPVVVQLDCQALRRVAAVRFVR
jgi:hypothetical protein